MVRADRFFDAEMFEKKDCFSGIFSQNMVAAFQNLNRPEGHVL